MPAIKTWGKLAPYDVMSPYAGRKWGAKAQWYAAGGGGGPASISLALSPALIPVTPVAAKVFTPGASSPAVVRGWMLTGDENYGAGSNNDFSSTAWSTAPVAGDTIFALFTYAADGTTTPAAPTGGGWTLVEHYTPGASSYTAASLYKKTAAGNDTMASTSADDVMAVCFVGDCSVDGTTTKTTPGGASGTGGPVNGGSALSNAVDAMVMFLFKTTNTGTANFSSAPAMTQRAVRTHLPNAFAAAAYTDMHIFTESLSTASPGSRAYTYTDAPSYGGWAFTFAVKSNVSSPVNVSLPAAPAVMPATPDTVTVQTSAPASVSLLTAPAVLPALPSLPGLQATMNAALPVSPSVIPTSPAAPSVAVQVSKTLAVSPAVLPSVSPALLVTSVSSVSLLASPAVVLGLPSAVSVGTGAIVSATMAVSPAVTHALPSRVSSIAQITVTLNLAPSLVVSRAVGLVVTGVSFSNLSIRPPVILSLPKAVSIIATATPPPNITTPDLGFLPNQGDLSIRSNAMPYSIRAGDLLPDMVITILDQGEPVSLASVQSISVHIKYQDTSNVLVKTATPNPDQVGSKGQATVVWASGETDDVGEHECIAVCQWPTDIPRTFPGEGEASITFTEAF